QPPATRPSLPHAETLVEELKVLQRPRVGARTVGQRERGLRAAVRAAEADHDRLVVGVARALEPVHAVDQRGVDRMDARARAAANAAIGKHPDRRGVTVTLEHLDRFEDGLGRGHGAPWYA